MTRQKPVLGAGALGVGLGPHAARLTTADHCRIWFPPGCASGCPVPETPCLAHSWWGSGVDHPRHKTQPEDAAQAPPRAQGLHEPELASFRGTGPGRVTTLSQSRSCELRGKNVNEDTILNVESRTLCEPAPSSSRKTRPACTFCKSINKAVLRRRAVASTPCGDFTGSDSPQNLWSIVGAAWLPDSMGENGLAPVWTCVILLT